MRSARLTAYQESTLATRTFMSIGRNTFFFTKHLLYQKKKKKKNN